MVVEDEEKVRNLTVKVLRRQGYSVLEAGDGRSCLDALRRHKGPLDLLLTDLVMPGLNGRELHEEVTTLFPKAKVLYMSGYTEEVVTHRGVLEKGIPFLQKPFSVHALTTRIREVLEDQEE